MGAVPASSGNLSDLPTPPSSAMNLNNSELSETTGTADIEQKETPPKSKSETSSRIVSALESRNNEQIELNQAILMSLRPPSPLKESNEPVDPQSVDLLVEMMNCSAEQANETLKSCGNNLEEAINSLL
jgi:NACalpha-BTF3-like transcription factor